MMTARDRDARLLIVDDDRAFRLTTAALLRSSGYAVDVAVDSGDAIAKLHQVEYDLMILDLRMPDMDGLRLIEVLRLRGNGTPVLMISGFGTIDAAVRAVHLGADDFLTKPVEPDLLERRVRALLDGRPSAPKVLKPGGIVGRSRAMLEVMDALEKVAPTEATVLITGETGTGKELLARAVHQLSPRRREPYVAVNCASLSDGVLESELFGHLRGAFTGALRDRVGLFEAASGGTVFLDEIGDVSLSVQQRLLRVLQEREVTRVGDIRSVRIDVRVVAATSRDLHADVKAGRFREDLLYRLAVFPLALPPLRAREGDIPLLVNDALNRIRGQAPGRDSLSCSMFAMRVLRAYPWPGNVRQLFAAVESAAIHANFGRIEAQHLPPDVRRAIEGDEPGGRYRASSPVSEERASIEAALSETGGVVKRAAELLGMGRTTLWRKLKVYGLASRTSRPAEIPGDPASRA